MKLVALLLAVGMLVMPTASASAQTGVPDGSLGIRLLDAPVDRAEDPRALIYVIDHVGPGTSFSRRVEVINGTGEDQTVGVEVLAADVDGGSFTIRDDVRTPLLDWIAPAVESIELRDGTAQTVNVDFDVPADASEGEYYGAVVASVTRESDGGISTVSRVGVRIYLSVGVGGEPAANFSITSMTPFRDQDGTPGVKIEVTNTGGRALDIVGELELRDGPGGTSAGPFEIPRGPTLTPGQTADAQVMLDRALPAGPWTARATLRSGLLERVAEAVLTFPDEASVEADPVEAVPITRDRNFLVPLAGSLLLLAIVFLALAWARARRHAKPSRT